MTRLVVVTGGTRGIGAAVATAWSSGPAFAMSATSVLVIPAPMPRLFATMPERAQHALVSAWRARTGTMGGTHR